MPSMAFDGSERMAEIVTMLSVVRELLVGLTANLKSATADEIPALCEEAPARSSRLTSTLSMKVIRTHSRGPALFQLVVPPRGQPSLFKIAQTPGESGRKPAACGATSKAMTTLADLNQLWPADHNATPWVATPDGSRRQPGQAAAHQPSAQTGAPKRAGGSN
jgi:hypothetical protein